MELWIDTSEAMNQRDKHVNPTGQLGVLLENEDEIFQRGVQSLWEWPINDWFDLMKEKKRCSWLMKSKYTVCLQLEGMKPGQDDGIHTCGEEIPVPLTNIGSHPLISETPITHSIHIIYPLLKVLL